jgi:uncharacterized metal-binding protein
MSKQLPLVFACSGCSNAGQLADLLARELNRRGLAEMSCLAGLGAKRAVFLKKLASRKVWLIDGCPIDCAAGVLDQVGEAPDLRLNLHDLGIKKNGTLPDEQRWEELVGQLIEKFNANDQWSSAAETLDGK